MNKQVFNPKSKTHWVSSATGAVGGLMLFAPQVMQYIPEDYYGPIFIGLGVIFHVLRNVTTSPIEDK